MGPGAGLLSEAPPCPCPGPWLVQVTSLLENDPRGAGLEWLPSALLLLKLPRWRAAQPFLREGEGQGWSWVSRGPAVGGRKGFRRGCHLSQQQTGGFRGAKQVRLVHCAGGRRL